MWGDGTYHLCSRIQAVLMHVPTLNKVIIIDAGSFFGMKVLARDGAPAAEDDESSPDRRRPLMVGPTESVVVDCHNGLRLVLNPPLCIGCHEAKASAACACGQWVLCCRCRQNQMDDVDLGCSFHKPTLENLENGGDVED